MATTIWTGDLSRELKYKSTVLPKFEPPSFKLTLNDDVADLLEKDKDGARQHQAMVDDANDALKAMAERVKSDLETLDKIYPAAKDEKTREAAVEAFESELEAESKKLEKEVEAIPEKRWATWVKTKKEYKEYKVKTGFSITKSVLGVVGSGLSLGAAIPTGGATLALSIVGLVRSSLALGQVLVKAWAEAEKVQKKIEISVSGMEKIYKEKGAQAMGAASVGSTALNSILGVDLAPNIKTMESDLDLWGSKLKGLDVAAGKAASTALEMLEKADKLEDLLKKSASKQAGKIMDNLKKLRKHIDDNLEKCHAQSKRVKKGDEAHGALASVIKAMKEAEPKWAVIFDKVLPVVISGAFAAANAADGFKEATNAADYANTALSLANDIADNIKDAVD